MSRKVSCCLARLGLGDKRALTRARDFDEFRAVGETRPNDRVARCRILVVGGRALAHRKQHYLRYATQLGRLIGVGRVGAGRSWRAHWRQDRRADQAIVALRITLAARYTFSPRIAKLLARNQNVSGVALFPSFSRNSLSVGSLSSDQRGERRRSKTRARGHVLGGGQDERRTTAHLRRRPRGEYGSGNAGVATSRKPSGGFAPRCRVAGVARRQSRSERPAPSSTVSTAPLGSVRLGNASRRPSDLPPAQRSATSCPLTPQRGPAASTEPSSPAAKAVIRNSAPQSASVEAGTCGTLTFLPVKTAENPPYL